jgi:hypothetical protein
MKLDPLSSDKIAWFTGHYRLQERTPWTQQAPAPMQIAKVTELGKLMIKAEKIAEEVVKYSGGE